MWLAFYHKKRSHSEPFAFDSCKGDSISGCITLTLQRNCHGESKSENIVKKQLEAPYLRLNSTYLDL